MVRKQERRWREEDGLGVVKVAKPGLIVLRRAERRVAMDSEMLVLSSSIGPFNQAIGPGLICRGAVITTWEGGERVG